MTGPTIRDLMTDPDLFGAQFSGDSWAAWRALLAGFYGLELTDAELDTFKALTGLSEAPSGACDELWEVIGRRGGKSQIAALLAVFEAAFRDYSDRLSPGEVASVLVLACDRRQARTVMRYIGGLLHNNAMLERMVTREERESIELANRTVIEVSTASFRAVRGYTVAAVIADEIAFWRSDESANPDHEILNALRPAMATLDGRLIALSSPYARKGALWDHYRRYYGKPGPILVAQASSQAMNPLLPDRVINEAMHRDPSAARAEYMAEFRSDIESFLDREIIDKLVRPEPLELPFDRRWRYQAFVDPSGGGADEFSICIGHKPTDTKIHGVNIGGASDKVIIDVLRARRGPPAAIAREYAQLVKTYGIKNVEGDKYAGSWPAQEFERHGIRYHHSRKSKSDLYVDALAAFNNGRVELPPDERLVIQLAGLERKTSRAGKDSIDHAPGGHDDRANAVAGLISTTASRSQVSTKVAAVGGCY